ncbi:MAG: small multi-drug export protein [Clostridiales bacterium]|nr:small multi-drug export protein [Clostridiales bacterium]
MELNLQWLMETMMGEFTLTVLFSMIPVVELRGGIPFGVTLGLPVWAAFIAAVIGNLIPVPFIIVYIRRILQWMRERIPRLNRLVDALERKAHLKGRRVTKYKYLGLAIFVAIPLPGTGAWTGALAAAFLDMPLRRALPSVIAGVVTAGLAISILTYGVASLF